MPVPYGTAVSMLGFGPAQDPREQQRQRLLRLARISGLSPDEIVRRAQDSPEPQPSRGLQLRRAVLEDLGRQNLRNVKLRRMLGLEDPQKHADELVAARRAQSRSYGAVDPLSPLRDYPTNDPQAGSQAGPATERPPVSERVEWLMGRQGRDYPMQLAAMLGFDAFGQYAPGRATPSGGARVMEGREGGIALVGGGRDPADVSPVAPMGQQQALEAAERRQRMEAKRLANRAVRRVENEPRRQALAARKQRRARQEAAQAARQQRVMEMLGLRRAVASVPPDDRAKLLATMLGLRSEQQARAAEAGYNRQLLGLRGREVGLQERQAESAAEQAQRELAAAEQEAALREYSARSGNIQAQVQAGMITPGEAADLQRELDRQFFGSGESDGTAGRQANGSEAPLPGRTLSIQRQIWPEGINVRQHNSPGELLYELQSQGYMSFDEGRERWNPPGLKNRVKEYISRNFSPAETSEIDEWLRGEKESLAERVEPARGWLGF